MRKDAAVLTSVVVAAVALPSAAAAAPKRIPPAEILSGVRLEGVKVGASSKDEAIVIANSNAGPTEAALVARVRNASGGFGPTQELTRSTSAELPSGIPFNSAGDTFLSWGAGGGGERAFRKAGRLFSAPMSWSTAACTRFSSVKFTAAGLPQVICSANAGSGAANDVLVANFPLTSEGTTFGIGQLLQPSVDDNFLRPQFDIGPDGTRAVAWHVNETSGPTTIEKIRLSVAAPGASFASGVTVAQVSRDLGFVDLGGAAVLADGRVAVVYEKFDGIARSTHLLIRKPDGAIVDNPLPTTTAQGRLDIVRDGDGALVLWAQDTGFDTPTTYRIANLVGDSVTPESTQVLDSGVPGTTMRGPLLVAPNGAAAFVRSVPVSGDRVLGAWVRPARGRPFARPVTIGTADGMPTFSAAMDKHGSIAAAWIVEGGPANKVLFGGLDAAGPTLTRLAVPGRLRVGRAGRFSVSAGDPAGVKTVKWSFGDRKSASGAAASHSYRRPGRYRVAVVATDRSGQQSKVTRTVRVGR